MDDVAAAGLFILEAGFLRVCFFVGRLLFINLKKKKEQSEVL